MASSPNRRLVLLRHAKSAWPGPPAPPDHDRPLAGRGRRDAPAVGRWLREAGCVPDQVWCSTAQRAVQTWQLAAAELGVAPPVDYQRDLRSEEHTSELQSLTNLVCRLLLEKK